MPHGTAKRKHKKLHKEVCVASDSQPEATCPSRDIWQTLETFLIVTIGGGDPAIGI